MHLATYKAGDAGAMLAHYERSIGPRGHIDPGLPVVNFASAFPGGCQARFKALCAGLDIGPKTRPLADFIVTKPEGCAADDDAFFAAVYEEFEAIVGKERIVSAYVHFDEPGAQPHMHFAFVPIVENVVMTNDKAHPLLWTDADERKNRAHKAGTQKTDSKGTPRWKRVPLLDENGRPVVNRTATASKMFSRKDMADLHPKIEAALCGKLGLERVGLVLAEEDAKKKLSVLGHDEYVRATKEIERAAVEEREAVERLERLRQREGNEAAAIEKLDREIEEKELEPLGESLIESAGALVANRGDGARERELEAENASLRVGIGKLERDCGNARIRISELRAGIARLRGRIAELGVAIKERMDRLARRGDPFAAAIKASKILEREREQEGRRRRGRGVGR